MTGTFPIRQAACLAIALLLLLPALLFTQTRNMKVQDAIEMNVFTDPDPTVQKEVKYSTDNRWLAIVTQRGLLQTNELESTVWVFDMGAVGRYLSASTESHPPEPKVVVRMAAVSNDSAITQVRWLNGNELAFLGRDKTSTRGLFTADVTTGALERQTPSDQDVTAFDTVSGAIIYTVRHIDAAPIPSEKVLTAHSLFSLLRPVEEDPDRATYFAQPAELWVMRNRKASPVLDRTTGKPVQVVTSMLSLSPSGRTVVVAQYPERIPKAWEEYEPAQCAFCRQLRLKATPSETKQVDLLLRFLYPKQYAFVDLNTGKIDPIDAPVGEQLFYSGPEKAVWLEDSHSVILVNTYLPLENATGPERQRRLQKPCVAVFDDRFRYATCIAEIRQTNPEDAYKNLAGFFLSDVSWDSVTKHLILSYETWGNDDEPAKQEQAEVYRLDNGRWMAEQRQTLRPMAQVSVEVRQDLNDPPALFAKYTNGGVPRKLWDPNPQLNGMRLGEVSVFHWKDKTGYEWTGGLVKPPDYVRGQKYALVIQTHGFNRDEFMTVGPSTTAFAARPLAARGIVVLQVSERFDQMGTPEEGPLHVEAYLSAIDHLARDGLVDPARVGLIGFSRTGYYAMEALTKAPKRFAAATIADSGCPGYVGRLLAVDIDSAKRDMLAIFGSEPFGEGLKAWIERAPTFNLDKVLAPLRIEVHDVKSLLIHWEVYASLRLQHKPVDMIQLPDAVHIVVKPLERLASEQGDVDWFDFWLNGHEDPDSAKAAQYARWRLLRDQKNESRQSSN